MADELYQHEVGSIRVNSDDCMSTSYIAGCLRCREPWPCAFVGMVEQRDAAQARAESLRKYVQHSVACQGIRDHALQNGNPAERLPCTCGLRDVLEGTSHD